MHVEFGVEKAFEHTGNGILMSKLEFMSGTFTFTENLGNKFTKLK
jgi:hypothetical protein